ncbi:MAG: DUF6473 family protein [Pseudomonadota bacterium]
MSELRLGQMLQGVELCTYGLSRQQFRGPPPDLAAPFIAFIGGTETLGPYQPHPFASRVAAELGLGALNLGIKNAGLDVFLSDPEVLRAANHADHIVLETLSPANMSNAFYRVHPRRNDRVVEVRPELRTRLPALDTSDIHFTGHLLRDVAALSAPAMEELRMELQLCWIERLGTLVDRLAVPVHLLHIVDRRDRLRARLIDRETINAVRDLAQSVTIVQPSADARGEGTTAMSVLPAEAHVAAAMLSTAAHVEVARDIARHLTPQTQKARAS